MTQGEEQSLSEEPGFDARLSRLEAIVRALEDGGLSLEQSIERYREGIETLLAILEPSRLALAVEIASLPERIRGFGHVRAKNAAEADAREVDLMTRFSGAVAVARIAAE